MVHSRPIHHVFIENRSLYNTRGRMPRTATSSREDVGNEWSSGIRLTKTGRVSKACKGIPTHRCDICDKVYTRAEHLRRHQLNHQQKIFHCDHPGCHREFHREDLLHRHRMEHPRGPYATYEQGAPPPYHTKTLSTNGTEAPYSMPRQGEYPHASDQYPQLVHAPPLKIAPVEPGELSAYRTAYSTPTETLKTSPLDQTPSPSTQSTQTPTLSHSESSRPGTSSRPSNERLKISYILG